MATIKELNAPITQIVAAIQHLSEVDKGHLKTKCENIIIRLGAITGADEAEFINQNDLEATIELLQQQIADKDTVIASLSGVIDELTAEIEKGKAGAPSVPEQEAIDGQTVVVGNPDSPESEA